jgi:hypothetical protein
MTVTEFMPRPDAPTFCLDCGSTEPEHVLPGVRRTHAEKWKPNLYGPMNGCISTRDIGGRQFGIFHERYGSEKWNIRSHPIRADGVATDSWSLPRTSATSRSLLMLRAIPLLTNAILNPVPYCRCETNHCHGDAGRFLGLDSPAQQSAWRCECCKAS